MLSAAQFDQGPRSRVVPDEIDSTWRPAHGRRGVHHYRTAEEVQQYMPTLMGNLRNKLRPVGRDRLVHDFLANNSFEPEAYNWYVTRVYNPAMRRFEREYPPRQ